MGNETPCNRGRVRVSVDWISAIQSLGRGEFRNLLGGRGMFGWPTVGDQYCRNVQAVTVPFGQLGKTRTRVLIARPGNGRELSDCPPPPAPAHIPIGIVKTSPQRRHCLLYTSDAADE